MDPRSHVVGLLESDSRLNSADCPDIPFQASIQGDGESRFDEYDQHVRTLPCHLEPCNVALK